MSRHPSALHRILRSALTAGLLAATACWPGMGSLRAEEGARLAGVDAKGATTVAKETILAKVQSKAGGPYQSAVVSEDIRRLFSLGYFTDVRADLEPTPEGPMLVFVVKEKPAISAVRLEGNRALPTTKALELFVVRSGDLYDARKVKEGIELVKAEYARKGYAEAAMASRVEPNESANTVALSLLVDEGPRMRISRILVEGNQAFSDRKIRSVLKTKQQRWFLPGVYAEQVLQEDLDRIREFYRAHGYQDIEAAQQVYRDPSGHGLIIHVTLTEGLQHRVGQVALEGAVLFPERELLRTITLKPGAVYSEAGVQEDLRRLKQYYGDRGYIHAAATPDPQLDQATKRVNLTYHLVEHELVHVRRIEVRGNLRTKDVVIRRELRIYPGEPFNGAKIRKSLERLNNLGYFEETNVETEPTKAADREDLVVRVKEAKTGSFSFGGGFSSVDRLIGLVELEQRNFDWRNVPQFTGAGEDLRFRVEIGSVRRYFDLSFTEPWIFGYPLSFGLDAYNRTQLRSGNLGLGYEQQQRGGGVRFGKDFTDQVTGTLNYQFFRTEISNVDSSASADLKAEQGHNLISEIGTSISWDRRDSRFDPTRGLFLFTSADLAGGVFGGDKNFCRVQAGASYYAPHFDRFVLESRLRTGIVDAYGDSDEVPIFERFFSGGSGTIRGFRERRVGPRDPNTNDPIGGEATAVGTVEEVMTMIKDEHGRSILKGSLFLDVGDVWRRVGDFGRSFKAGVGVGTRVNTPIGPVRLDVGYPVSKTETGESRKLRFHFNVSRSF